MRYVYALIPLIMLSGCFQQTDSEDKEWRGARFFPSDAAKYRGDGELEGHTWQVDKMTFSFQSGNHVLVRGGHLDDTMPTGAPGRYTLEKKVLLLEVLGREYTGHWNKRFLWIKDHRGVYQGVTDQLFPDSALPKSGEAGE